MGDEKQLGIHQEEEEVSYIQEEEEKESIVSLINQ